MNTDDKEARYQQLCSAAYILAGEVGAPERFLNALRDGANGEPGTVEDSLALLPVTLDECDPS